MLDSGYCTQIASGFITGVLVAPVVSIVDQSIVSNASGREKSWSSVKRLTTELVRRPVRFCSTPTFTWVAAVFCSTYIGANIAEEFCIRRKENPSKLKFIATASFNIPVSAMKDRAFAKMFSSGHITVPKISVALFAIRDGITVGSSFVLPTIISPYIQKQFQVSEYNATTSAILLSPLIAQVFNTPLFVLGLDLANNKETPGRIKRITTLYIPTLLARWARIFPAFSIGGCVNRYIKEFN